MKEFATPSAFLAMEQAAGGINCWKKGQHFKGVEISVELGYLRETLLPFLGLSAEALDFWNVRYLHLPEELQDLIFRVEQRSSETRNDGEPFKISCSRVCISAGASGNPFHFCEWRGDAHRKDQVGKKEIRMKKEDFQKSYRFMTGYGIMRKPL